jgi:hypothetical protein
MLLVKAQVFKLLDIALGELGTVGAHVQDIMLALQSQECGVTQDENGCGLDKLLKLNLSVSHLINYHENDYEYEPGRGNALHHVRSNRAHDVPVATEENHGSEPKEQD